MYHKFAILAGKCRGGTLGDDVDSILLISCAKHNSKCAGTEGGSKASEYWIEEPQIDATRCRLTAEHTRGRDGTAWQHGHASGRGILLWRDAPVASSAIEARKRFAFDCRAASDRSEGIDVNCVQK